MNNICLHCGNEKIRIEREGAYRYACFCLVWRDRMKVLEYARKRESMRPRILMEEAVA